VNGGRALDGRVALVTGAAAGIGRASSLLFAREGARVVIADIDDEGGKETVALVEAEGGDATFVHADVSAGADVARMVQHAVEHFGGLDCALNNAGMPTGGQPIADYPESEWDRAIAVMLTGVFLGMKYEVPAMLARGGGAIVNVSSVAGLTGYPGQSGYIAAKHGVIGLTRTVALEYGAQGIRVNAICPGTTRTPMTAGALDHFPEVAERLVSSHPIGRVASAEEIAEAAVWLCTDAASFVLGAVLPVDGGYTAL
jgi:NAD(P)-dependent dehydrogenase (short-subunit alcohol dehydrogenase family)